MIEKPAESLRYHTFNRYLRKRFGGRVQKIPLDAGFGCPHRGGEEGRDGQGCIYCRNAAFSPHGRQARIPPLKEQLEAGIRFGGERYGAKRFLAYFQAYTNTFASLEILKERYDTVRQFPEIVGLTVGTRPDCMDEAVLDLLESYCSDYEVWVEIGLQSALETTLKRIRRGHSVQDFFCAVERTARRRMLLCVHVILGLPGESRQDMMKTATLLAGLPIQGIKIHHCHVIKGTLLAEAYHRGDFQPMEYDDYLACVCDFLEHIPWPVTIQRLVGEAPDDLLLAPAWGKNKSRILGEIQHELARRNSRQGIKCS